MNSLVFSILAISVLFIPSFGIEYKILKYYITRLWKPQHSIIFSCEQTGVKRITNEFMINNNFMRIIYLNSTYNINLVLTYKAHAKTAIVLDCNCKSAENVILKASEARFLNKTFDWMLWDKNNICLQSLLHKDVQYLGPNAQITHVGLKNSSYIFTDIHSKGKHLGAPLEFVTLAKIINSKLSNMLLTDINTINDITEIRSITYRDNFNGLTLRGASVIDQDNITSNSQITEILGRLTKDVGVSAFSKYHFELSEIIRTRLNFTVNYRNARGWAGKIENSTFRLGYIGIMQRNEADIGASASYNRINRFSELDIIQQSWKFESSFLFRFTSDLNVRNKRGNFLAPFEIHVWILSAIAVITLSLIWIVIESSIYFMNSARWKQIGCGGNFCNIALYITGAICQQGLDPVPKEISSRIVMITLITFSLVMYNYYTSSLVGGLLSNTEQGPSTVDEIISSELRLSFEDIGYYKILFRENKSGLIERLLNRKILPPRDPQDLPIYTRIEDAIPYIKRGLHAFHCEVVDAYPEISRQFDAGEICDLRVVSGLLVTELINSVVHKNSQYTELFRLIMIQSREIGLIKRLLHQRQPKKPECQSLYTVYPVNFFGIADAFIFLIVGILISLLALGSEILRKHYSQCN